MFYPKSLTHITSSMQLLSKVLVVPSLNFRLHMDHYKLWVIQKESKLKNVGALLRVDRACITHWVVALFGRKRLNCRQGNITKILVRRSIKQAAIQGYHHQVGWAGHQYPAEWDHQMITRSKSSDRNQMCRRTIVVTCTSQKIHQAGCNWGVSSSGVVSRSSISRWVR